MKREERTGLFKIVLSYFSIMINPYHTLSCNNFICNFVFQLSAAARVLVQVPPTRSYSRVEHNSAVCVTGSGCAGVCHLSLTVGQRPSQRHLSTLLLQAAVQPQCLELSLMQSVRNNPAFSLKPTHTIF